MTSAKAEDKVICALCRRQFSKYYCPKCNVPYCSLTCFRSEAHSECSEGFYKKEIETGIQTESSRSAEERLKMMGLLKRFEEESGSLSDLDDDDDDDGDDSEGEDDLSRRMRNIDIDSVDADDLWTMLTPAERQKFLSAVGDRNSEIAQDLLASEVLDRYQRLPWWEKPLAMSEDDVEEGDENEESDKSRSTALATCSNRYGSEPKMAPIPESLTRRTNGGASLCYNMVAICIAYAYITRTLQLSPLSSAEKDSAEHIETKRLVSELVPFLTDRSSTQAFKDLGSVQQHLWARFGAHTMAQDEFAVLCRDALVLFQPLRVTELSSDADGGSDGLDGSAHRNLVLVFSDLWAVYSHKIGDEQQESRKEENTTKVSRTAQKLIFYGGQAVNMPSFEVMRICAELEGLVMMTGQ